MKTTLKKSKVIALLSLSLFAQSFTLKNKPMKIKVQQNAPIFTTNDVNGNIVNLSDYKGKKILLVFNRNVGCPVCNLHYHELMENKEYFKEKGLVIISVYESTTENMKAYLEGETTYSTMIPNPDLSLYKLYAVERSMRKVMKGMFNGAMGKMKKGKQLFSKKIKQDGTTDRIGAEFLIDENGVVKIAHYGNYVGDHLPVEKIKQIVK